LRYLPLPATVAEERAVLAKLAKQAMWAPHLADWQAAYDAYHLAGGDPHVLGKSAFDVVTGAAQAKLYEGRRRTVPLEAIRRQVGLLSCPVCGSSSQGSLDHYLPKEDFGEFSIMRANLIPACSHCNSDEKGTVYKGVGSTRLLHPYYDDWLDAALWRVRIVPPFAAPTFEPEAMPGLAGGRPAIVAFHLSTVIGRQFRISMANWWSTLPAALSLRLRPPVTRAALDAQLVEDLAVADATTGTNSWQTAALRGLAADAAAVADVLARL
jgi:5-methylcytosine-specific restriction endonuclease McrA